MPTISVFIDTSAFVALNNPQDFNYKRIIEILEKAKKEKFIYITSNYIIAETLTVISQRISHTRAVNFFEKDLEGIDIKHIAPELESDAFNIFKGASSKNLSFVDCTSFALMNTYRINIVLGFDQHFKKHGFKLLD